MFPRRDAAEARDSLGHKVILSVFHPFCGRPGPSRGVPSRFVTQHGLPVKINYAKLSDIMSSDL